MGTWLLHDVLLAMGAALLGGALTLLLRALCERSRARRDQVEIANAIPAPPRPPGLTHFLAATAAATADLDTVILTAPASIALASAISTQSPNTTPDTKTSSLATPMTAPPALPKTDAASGSSITPSPRPAEASPEPHLSPDPEPISQPTSAPSFTLPVDLPQTAVTMVNNASVNRPEPTESAVPPPPPPPPPTQSDLAMAAERLTQQRASQAPAQLLVPMRPSMGGRIAGPDLPQVRPHHPVDALGTRPGFARPVSIWRPPTTRFLSSLVSGPNPT